MRKDERALIELIDTIYLCGSGNCEWQTFLDQYGALFPSLKSAMTGYDRKFTNVEMFCTSNYDLAFINTYAAHYYKLNPWQEVILNSPLIPNVSWAPEIPLSRLQKIEFYADWINPQDNVAYGFTTMLFNESDRFINLTSNVNPRHIDEARRAARSLAIIGPHLRRAFELSRQLMGAQVQIESMHAVMDVMMASIFIVDSKAKLRHANAKGERLLTQGLVVRSGHGGYLIFSNSGDHRAVMDAIHRAESHIYCGGPQLIALKGAAKGRYLTFVTPLVVERIGATVRKTEILTPSMPIGVFIIDSNELSPATLEHIAEALGVTPAEARLAFAMLHDKTLQEYADEQEISIHTVRIQMRSLLAKTNTRRQSELVNLLAKAFSTFTIA